MWNYFVTMRGCCTCTWTGPRLFYLPIPSIWSHILNSFYHHILTKPQVSAPMWQDCCVTNKHGCTASQLNELLLVYICSDRGGSRQDSHRGGYSNSGNMGYGKSLAIIGCVPPVLSVWGPVHICWYITMVVTKVQQRLINGCGKLLTINLSTKHSMFANCHNGDSIFTNGVKGPLCDRKSNLWYQKKWFTYSALQTLLFQILRGILGELMQPCQSPTESHWWM